jgi:lipoyl(octanoyl) transferase
VHLQKLGRINYAAAWEKQEQLFKETVDLKVSNRKVPEAQQRETKNHLLLCEHPPVYTLGKSGDLQNLLLSQDELDKLGAQFFKINRGGDITFHGPGQLVGYPILDLDHFFSDVHRYLFTLEEVFIRVLKEYGLQGERSKGETGVWLDVGKPTARKICALGIKASRWVTMHGWAFNVNTNLDWFHKIVPCGITDKGVTSLQKELGQELSMAEVQDKVLHHFQDLFTVEFTA